MSCKNQIISAVVCCALLASACENEDCLSVSNNALLVDFYSSDSSALKEISFDYVTAAATDSVFIEQSDRRSSYSLPLNPAADETVFYMQVIDTVVYDTITVDPLHIDTVVVLRDLVDTFAVRYNRTQRVIALECGVEIAYGSIETIRNTFTGDEVVQPSLSRFNDVNIKIYY